MSVTIASVARLATDWEQVGFFRGGQSGLAEALIHELAHASVLGIRPSPSVSDDVAMRFRQYTLNLAADRSECAALAVEKLVFRELGWRLNFRRLLGYAMETIREMSLHEVRAEVVALVTEQRTARRAVQVIAWLARESQRTTP